MSLFAPFILSFLAVLTLAPLTIGFAKKYGLVDDPRRHKHPAILHNRTIPRAGGLAIYLGVLIASALVLPLDKKFLGIFGGGLILVIVGLWDDRRDLPNWVKLLAQFVAALVVVGAGIGITFITNPLLIFERGGLGLGPVIHLDTLRLSFNFLGSHSILLLADLFAIFWIVWVINMVNFSTGVDGQMPGIVFVALAVIFGASLRMAGVDPSQLVVVKLALVGGGATLAFLIFNFYPARIFPGDSGSYFLGFLVAVCAILAGARVGTAMMVLAVPLADGVFTIVRRIAARKSPFAGDRLHLHHRLLSLGWGQAQIALFYWLLCAILGSAALVLHSVEKVFAALFIFIIVLGGLLWLNMNLSQKARE